MRIGERQVFRKRNCTNCSPCSSQQRGGLREVTKAKNDKSKAQKLNCSVCEALFTFNPSGHITEDMRRHHFVRKDPVVCYKCHEKGKVLVREDRQKLKARKLMCSKCKKPFDFDSSGHINESMRRNHLRSIQAKVICYACQPKKYTCTRCGDYGPRENFQQTNFERDHERGSLQCLECKEGRRKGKTCIRYVCKKFIPEEELPASEIKHRNRALICEECQKKGYTLRYTETYTCCVCQKTGGSGIFQAQNLQRAKERGMQKCKTCFG